MGELWTPLREGPHEAFVERLYRVVSRFAEEHGVEKPLVEVELNDGLRFVVDQIIPEPGYGMVTLNIHSPDDGDAPEAIVIPIGTIRRIELRSTPDDQIARFGFSVPPVRAS
jgi:hypothetical protein